MAFVAGCAVSAARTRRRWTCSVSAPAGEYVRTPRTAPVLSGGLLFLGHLPEYLQDRDGLMSRGHDELGDVFLIDLMFHRMAIVAATPTLAATFFDETDKSLNASQVYQPMKDALGHFPLSLEHDQWLNMKPVLDAAFNRDSARIFFSAIVTEVGAFVDSLDAALTDDSTDSTTIPDLFTAVLDLGRAVVAHAFFGPSHRHEIDPALWSAYNAARASLDFVVPRWIPLPKFSRGRHALAAIRDILGPIISARARPGGAREDLLSQVLLRVDRADGTPIPREQVEGNIIGLIFAGHETTAYQAAWTLIHLAQNRDYLRVVQREVDEVLGEAGAPDTVPRVRALEHTFRAVDETARLRPTAEGLVRLAVRDVTLGDVTVPRGARVLLNILAGHYSAGVFSEPGRYDPARFGPGRREGGVGAGLTSFGGGGHPCLGRNVARTEIAVLVAMVVQRYDVEVVPERPTKLLTAGTPRVEASLRYTRRRRGVTG